MSVSRFVNFFFPLFLVFFLLDLEINLISFSGEDGERVGAAAYNELGEHVSKDSQEVPLKISDLFFLALSFCFFCILSLTKAWKVNVSFWKHYFLILLYITLSALTIFLSDGMSISQKIVCYLYLIKFFQATFIYVLTYFYFSCGGSIKPLFQGLLITTYIMTFFGLLGALSWNLGWDINWSWIIPERVQYYGTLSLLSIIWLVFIFKNIPSMDLLGLKKNQLLVLFIFTFITIMLCGKRTIMLAYIASIFFMFVSTLSYKDIKKALPYGVVLAIFLLPFLSTFIERTFNANDGATLNLAAGLAPRYVELIQDSSFSNVELTGVDFSITERVVKALYSINLAFENPLFGSGYWSSPFEHNYLPDSALFQILVEGGIVGLLVITLFIFSGWSKGKKVGDYSNLRNFNSIYRVCIIFLIIAGLAANTVYTFSLFGLLVFLSCLNRLQKFNLLN